MEQLVIGFVQLSVSASSVLRTFEPHTRSHQHRSDK